ncbi:MAG: penicillin acylase family protein, partial [Candidatus Kapabacteria bacterium]|nr:penicillin acylase family protein [Candidatus Kapabacteria bacterium]
PITYTHTLQRRDTADMRRDTTQRDSTSRLNGAYLNKQSSRGAVAAMSAMMEHVRSIIGMKGMQSGSNCWVMRTSPNSKELVFANDPHLSLGLPPRWYQAHLSCPQFNVVGVTLPGIPVVISGRNDNIAWGITNMMLDDFDYFFEDVDAKNPAFYRNTEGIRTKFRYIRDTIIIKGKENEPYIFDYRSTNRSGIISDAHITKEQDKIFEYPAGRSSIASKYALSYSWTARESSDEILASLRIMRASSWTEFTNATLTWNTPALNFTYADERGNMGIAPSGFTPIRGEGNPNLPHPGWEAKFAWQGVRRSDALPRIYNPQRGYVFSANNLTMRGMDFHVSSLWEPPSRSERIMELLSEYQEYSSREAQFMQLDLTSPYSRTLLQTVLPVLRYDSTNFTPSQNQCIRTLANWDNVMAGNGNAAAIYTVFLDRLMANTFTARINPELYHKYAFVGSLPLRKLHEILQDSSASWFSDWGSQSKQKYKTVIILSLKEAQQHLESLYGEEMSQWRYADMHPLRLQHPLGRGTQLSSVVNKEVNTLGGDATTLNNTLWQINTPYDIKVGASMRFVCNMRDSVVYSVVPGGSSGQPLDAHYSDQLQLWSSGGYVTLPIGRKPHSGFELYATLVPATDRPSDQ